MKQQRLNYAQRKLLLNRLNEAQQKFIRGISENTHTPANIARYKRIVAKYEHDSYKRFIKRRSAIVRDADKIRSAIHLCGIRGTPEMCLREVEKFERRKGDK